MDGNNLIVIKDNASYKEFLNFLNDPEIKVLNKKETPKGMYFKFNTEDEILVESHLLKEDKYDNSFIFGLDKTKKVVNVSVKDDVVHIFTEENGVVKETCKPASYFIVSRDSYKGFSRLKGKNYYNYINIFDKYSNFINTRKYLYGKDIWSIYDPEENNLVLKGITYFKDLKVQDVSVLSFDIETLGKNIDDTAGVLIISNTFRKNGKKIKKLFKYDDYESDADMINDWCKWVQKMNPSILLGHNIFGFDIPYLNYCYKREFGKNLCLGRDGSEIQINDYTSSKRKDGSQSYEFYNAKVFGRDLIDTFFLALTYDVGRKYVSYGLKQIISQEGLEKENRQHYDASKIKDNYQDPKEWKKIVEYAKDDADDALSLFDLMIPSYFYYAQSIPKTLQQIINSASGGQINSFLVRAYLSNNEALPKTSEIKNFEGAISLGVPGVYKNVAKADVASMYPSIILQYKLYDKSKDPNAYYLKMVEYFTQERLKNKQLAKDTGDRYYKDLEQSQKIGINSAYGICNAPGLLFNAPFMGAFITRKGREILIKAVDWATGNKLKINEDGEWYLENIRNTKYGIVNIDTDSFSFYGLKHNITQKEFNDFLKSLNEQFEEKIKWDDDGIYDSVLVLKAKNYVLKKGDIYKYKGSAIIDQKKEPAMTEFLKNCCISLMENKDSIDNLYNRYVKEALNIKDIKRWAVKKTVTSKVLENDRSNEKKIRDAIGETHVQEGDKIWVYTSKPILVPSYKKGEPEFLKNGQPKMKEDSPLKLIENWTEGDEDKYHYVSRVYSTLKILENVVDTEKFIKYNNKKNRTLLEDL